MDIEYLDMKYVEFLPNSLYTVVLNFLIMAMKPIQPACAMLKAPALIASLF